MNAIHSRGVQFIPSLEDSLLGIPVTMRKALGDQKELLSALPPSLPPPSFPSFFPPFAPQTTSPVFSTLSPGVKSHGLFSVEESVKGETVNKTDTASTRA